VEAQHNEVATQAWRNVDAMWVWGRGCVRRWQGAGGA